MKKIKEPERDVRNDRVTNRHPVHLSVDVQSFETRWKESIDSLVPNESKQ
jgi:hypothetical protein